MALNLHNAAAMESGTGHIPKPTTPALPGIRCDRVLCWVNSADEADDVVPVALALATKAAGACHVVMCLDTLKRGGAKGRPLSASAPLTPKIISTAGRRLAELYGDQVRTLVLPGDPVQEIRRYARNHQMDLVVVGGQGLDAERICGERLCDDAPCAVMILVIPKEK